MDKKLKESIVSGMSSIPVCQSQRDLNEFDKWMSIVNEAEKSGGIINEGVDDFDRLGRIYNAFTHSKVGNDYNIAKIVAEYDTDSWADFVQDLQAQGGVRSAEGVVGGMEFDEEVVRSLLQNEMQSEQVGELDDVLAEFDDAEITSDDLNNGYGNDHKTTKNYQDYFPSGATSPATDHAGPASAKQGDNPMQKDMVEVDADAVLEAKEIHTDLVYSYRRFLNE